VARVERLRNFFRDNPRGEPGEGSPDNSGGASGDPSPGSHAGAVARLEAFRDALAEDFNTPRALAEAFELVGEANRDEVDADAASQALAEMLDLVGLSSLTQPDKGAETDEDAQKLMKEREEARAGKDFVRADELRDQLAELGWTVRDSADGPQLVPRA